MIGTTISHYKILEKLGEGGMGVVYKAEDTKLRRSVALKLLPPSLLVNEDDRRRFVHEAQAFAALNHPNIATVFEIDESEAKTFIALEFVAGENLAEKVKSGPLKLDDALSIAIQTCEGLQAAHENGIVHRDIKSQNIMVTPKGKVKILDFGLAKLRGATVVTKAGTTLGTMGYMSPEQLRGEPVDHRADIWAVGVVLYEMIAGRRPFQGDYEDAIAYQVINQHPEPLTAIRTGVPMELERIVKKAMQKDLADRYQHTDELLTDLKLVKRRPESGVPIQPPASKSPLSRARVYIVGGAAALFCFSLIATYMLFSPRSASPEDKSIAILPFMNLSEDKESEYFSDGVTENLITDLTKIQGLRVIGRNSVFQFKGKTVDMKKVGEDLSARYVMEGSVQRSGDRLRVNANLINASTGYHLWADRYDRELKDFFSVQDDITSHIVAALRVTLKTGEIAPGSRTTNPDAQDLYLRGTYFMHKSDEENLNKALNYFQEALEKDPGYALPYAGIAHTYSTLADAYLAPMEAYPKVKAAARKALELDSTLAEARASLAYTLGAFDRDFAGANREFRRAIEFNPNSADIHSSYSNFLCGNSNNTEQSLVEADRAISLDPLSAAASSQKEYSLFLARRYDEAIQQNKRTLELDPHYFYFSSGAADAYREKGLFRQAVEGYLKAEQFAHGWPIPGLAITYARMGKRREAEKILHELENLSKGRYVSPALIAQIYAALAEKDMAFKWLERAYDVRDVNLLGLGNDPALDPLRSDPRFTVLMKKEFGNE